MTMPTCPRCRRPSLRRQRGVCIPCYAVLFRMVRRGETTWAELERRGLCVPKKRPHTALERIMRRTPRRLQAWEMEGVQVV